MLFELTTSSYTENTLVQTAKDTIPMVTPDFGKSLPSGPGSLKATWLGHACFLLEFPPSSPEQRGVRLLLDPVFSHRCSPSAYMGPARFTEPPCKVEDIPEIDGVIISHNHYDRECLVPYLDVMQHLWSDP